ncbi:MAG: radical SAM protein, partial [Spirochaetaceae bacterium]|nr:radical SAM protein [Spirochaetaceae bacterium]
MPLFIDQVKLLGAALLNVEKPARYTGGEYGRLAKRDAALYTAICFPDLYEIGMSNHALKIIYKRMNALDGIMCDRAFAPAPDFETLLAKKNIPLYGLDTGIPLRSVDVLMFTLGYELGITALLAMLQSASIPIHNEERCISKYDTSEISVLKDDKYENGGHSEFPIVMMGGVCASNPLPYSKFIDAFWIGEAEAEFDNLMEEVRDARQKGASRSDLLKIIRAHPCVWYAGKPVNERGFAAERAVYTDFGTEAGAAVFPVPSLRVVQQHGYVEIMRGCPGGCRFCHAGIWYRPARQKDAAHIYTDVEEYVHKGGFREISLSSLSSADYNGIDSLIYQLNDIYKNQYISFQLPSLHVSTFSLPLLEQIAKVRKSGLTFAVETPLEHRQFALNKTAALENIAAILTESKKRGWKGAKLYFMVGLPAAADGADYDEAAEIVNFVKELARRTRMKFVVNVGIFVPKPHTPFEREGQPEESGGAVKSIAAALRPLGHKVNCANALVSRVEGLLSRGGAEVGDVIEAAFRAGSRLDAWSDQFRFDIWEGLENEYAPLFAATLGAKTADAPLPWDVIDSGVHP